MQQQRFRVADRIRTLQPVGWVTRGSYGTIVRVFFGMDTYGVRFDHQTSIRVVTGLELEQIGHPRNQAHPTARHPALEQSGGVGP
jgi:hypothetical protein